MGPPGGPRDAFMRECVEEGEGAMAQAGKKPAGSVTGEKIWLDGEWIPWAEANVHILTHSLHYGLGVFEGIRCYQTDDGRSAIFRLPEHVRRLYQSAHINMRREKSKGLIGRLLRR